MPGRYGPTGILISPSDTHLQQRPCKKWYSSAAGCTAHAQSPHTMNIETLRDYCLSKPGVTEDCAFGPENVLFRICGKIFACIDLERPYLVVLKANPDYAIALRDSHNGITPAWHWNKTYWNDVRFDADVDDKSVLKLVDHSYDEVVLKLPKKLLYRFPDLPDGWHHEHLPVTDSVMNYIRQPEILTRPADFELITADYQTQGRGQRGTTWEAEDGKNLLFSFRFKPQGVKASTQFLLSEAIALAACKALSRYGSPGSMSIKWPNDIYYGDRKIGGMLIEHDLKGTGIATTIVGIGINVNQETFAGDAPNPVSLRQILGKEADRAAVLRNFLKLFMEYYTQLKGGESDKITAAYKRVLYRRSGCHRYRDAHGFFQACITDVLPDGTLMMCDSAGQQRQYAFKEVTFLND